MGLEISAGVLSGQSIWPLSVSSGIRWRGVASTRSQSAPIPANGQPMAEAGVYPPPMNRALATIAALLTLTACGTGSHPPAAHPSPSTWTMTGAINVTDFGERYRACDPGQAQGSAANVRPGAQVTVEDAHGTTVGTGSVDGSPTLAGSRYNGSCFWQFSVPGLPVSPFYRVRVAGTGPAVTVSRARAVRGVKLTIS